MNQSPVRERQVSSGGQFRFPIPTYKSAFLTDVAAVNYLLERWIGPRTNCPVAIPGPAGHDFHR